MEMALLYYKSLEWKEISVHKSLMLKAEPRILYHSELFNDMRFM